jgi:hypothetical protein
VINVAVTHRWQVKVVITLLLERGVEIKATEEILKAAGIRGMVRISYFFCSSKMRRLRLRKDY